MEHENNLCFHVIILLQSCFGFKSDLGVCYLHSCDQLVPTVAGEGGDATVVFEQIRWWSATFNLLSLEIAASPFIRKTIKNRLFDWPLSITITPHTPSDTKNTQFKEIYYKTQISQHFTRKMNTSIFKEELGWPESRISLF